MISTRIFLWVAKKKYLKLLINLFSVASYKVLNKVLFITRQHALSGSQLHVTEQLKITATIKSGILSVLVLNRKLPRVASYPTVYAKR